MNIEWLQQNWALIIAGILIVIVLANIFTTLVRRSAWGQLRNTLVDLEGCKREQDTARKRVEKAEKKLAAMQARVEHVKPSSLEEMKGVLSDKRALAKIADDQLMIAKNHVRRVIYEQFPPKKHAGLRSRYLPDDVKDKRPFSF